MPAIHFDPSKIEDIPRRGRRKDTAPKTAQEEVFTLPDIKAPAGKLGKDLRVIEDGLKQAFTFAGMGVSMFNLYDAMVIHENAELLARHWTRVAEQNVAFRNYLLAALQGGTWAGAIGVTVAVCIPIFANHFPDAIPVEMANMSKSVGVTLPDEGLKEVLPMRMSANGDGSSFTE